MTHETTGRTSRARTSTKSPMRDQHGYVHQARCHRGASERQRSVRRSRLRSPHSGTASIHRSVSQARCDGWQMPQMETVNGSILDRRGRSPLRPNANARTEGRRSGATRSPPFERTRNPRNGAVPRAGDQHKAYHSGLYHERPFPSRGGFYQQL